MRLVIFGASGLLGTRLVAEALSRGHQLTAVARDVTRIDDRSGQVATARGGRDGPRPAWRRSPVATTPR